MTEGMAPAPFATTPDAVAEAVVAGIASGAGWSMSPRLLRWVFAVMRLLPRAVWRRHAGLTVGSGRHGRPTPGPPSIVRILQAGGIVGHVGGEVARRPHGSSSPVRLGSLSLEDWSTGW